MELKKITWFLRIVDEGSLSKAAQSLYVSQPTLSRFLEKLESEVGTPLFIRDRSNNLHLAPAGESYLQTARKIQSLWQKLDQELEQQRQHVRQLVFGIHGDHLRSFAEECVKKMAERYPEITVRYFCDSAPEIQRLALQGKICMGVCAYEEKDPGLVYTQCSKTRMCFVVSEDHPLSHLAGVPTKLSQLQDASFAMMRGNTVLRRITEKWLKDQRCEVNVNQTYLRHGSLADVLTGGKLIGFCPENNISPHLCYIPAEPAYFYTQGICRPAKAPLTAAQRYLMTLLKKCPTHRTLK